MTDPGNEGGDARARRAVRLTEIVATLAKAHKSLAHGMSDTHFVEMIQRMAEHQLLYEEFGRDE